RVKALKDDGVGKDLCAWEWTLYCGGHGNCQRKCGGFGECLADCEQVGKKDTGQMHNCSVRIMTRVMLTSMNTPYPVHVQVVGNHLPSTSIVPFQPIHTRINLSREIRDAAILGREADRTTAVGLRRMMVKHTEYASRDELRAECRDPKRICTTQ